MKNIIHTPRLCSSGLSKLAYFSSRVNSDTQREGLTVPSCSHGFLFFCLFGVFFVVVVFGSVVFQFFKRCIYVYICMCINVHDWQCPMKPEEGTESPVAGVIDGHEPHNMGAGK